MSFNCNINDPVWLVNICLAQICRNLFHGACVCPKFQFELIEPNYETFGHMSKNVSKQRNKSSLLTFSLPDGHPTSHCVQIGAQPTLLHISSFYVTITSSEGEFLFIFWIQIAYCIGLHRTRCTMIVICNPL